MEIIILIIVCLVCLALGFFITKVILGKDLTTFQLKVENYEKIIDEKMSEIALLKKNFEIIQDQYHQKEIFLQKVTTELEERNKNLIVVNNNYRLHLPRSKSGQIKSKETLKLGYIKLRGFEKCEIGDEINYGDTYIKVNDTGKHSVDYKLKSKYLYEKYHNVKTEKHDIIVFLDGDRKNYSKENLYRISRSILTYMAFHGLYKKTSVDRLTKIKFCEWKEKINQLQVLSKS